MKYCVSFCIPTYNPTDGIVELVRDMLSVKSDEFQIVISDDASCDGSVEKLRKIDDARLKLVVNEQNVGSKLNWYKALEQGDGEFLYLVMGRDWLKANRIEALIRLLKLSKKKIKLFRDGRSRDIRTYEGAEAAKMFLKYTHPTGIIIERETWKNIENRKKYFEMATITPEVWVQRDILKISPRAAILPAGMYEGKHICDLAKNTSKFEKGKNAPSLPWFFPTRIVKELLPICKMGEEIGLSKKEADDFFISSCEQIFARVTYLYAKVMISDIWTVHYAIQPRKVTKLEMVKNTVYAYKSICSHYHLTLCEGCSRKLFALWLKYVFKILWDKF